MIEQQSIDTSIEFARDGLSPSGANPTVESVTLIEILTTLALRKRLIIAITGIATLVGIALSLLLPVRFTSSTIIMPPQQTQSTASMLMNQLASSGAAPLAAIASGGGLGLKSPNDLYVGLLNSRPIADSIIQNFGLLQVYRSKDMTAARKKLAGNTSVVSEKSGLISISVTDKDKKRAADMANAYTRELRALTKSLAVTEASQRRLFYEEELRQAKDALVLAEGQFRQVQQQKGLVALDAQAKAMIESLSALRARVAAKQVEVEALRSYSTDQNPDLQLAERELSSLQSEVARMEQNSHSSGNSELGLKDVPSAGLDYLRAEHEVRYRQALFDLLLKQYDAARLDEAKEAAIIQIVAPAIEADRKSAPRRTLIVLFSFALGLFAGSVFALFQWWRELLKRDPISNSQLEKFSRAVWAR